MHEKGQKWVFKLYISDELSIESSILDCFKEVLRKANIENYELKIINITKDPERSKRDEIMIIPALIRELPKPPIKIIGNISDLKRLCEILEIPFIL